MTTSTVVLRSSLDLTVVMRDCIEPPPESGWSWRQHARGHLSQHREKSPSWPCRSSGSRHNLIKRSFAGGIAIAAASFPTLAEARIGVDPPAGSGPAPVVSNAGIRAGATAEGHRSTQPGEPSAQQRLDQLQRNVQRLFAAEGGWHLSAPSTLAPAAPSGRGFRWGDAGIGAAGATVLLGAGALGVGMNRRQRRGATS
jgi:hypothetical protein